MGKATEAQLEVSNLVAGLYCFSLEVTDDRVITAQDHTYVRVFPDY